MTNDFPEFSDDELVRWLQAKYRRHGEIEDGVAAERIKSLSCEGRAAFEAGWRGGFKRANNAYAPGLPRSYDEWKATVSEELPPFKKGPRIMGKCREVKELDLPEGLDDDSA